MFLARVKIREARVGFGWGFVVGSDWALWWVLGGGLGFDFIVGGGLVVDDVVVLGL